METDYAAKFSAEELVFPEWWNAVELQSGAETQAGFGDSHAGKPIADGLERGGGDDGGPWAMRCRDASRVVANHDGVTKEFAEPFGGGSGVSRKANVALGILRRSFGAARVTLVKPGWYVARIRCRAGTRVALISWPSRNRWPRRVELQAAGGAYVAAETSTGSSDLMGWIWMPPGGNYWCRFHEIILAELSAQPLRLRAQRRGGL